MAAFNLPTAFYLPTGDGRYTPTEATVGPWSSEFQHGGPPCALLVNALRRFPTDGNLQIAKIAFEFFSAVPVSPCEINIQKIRGGRQVELLRGRYLSQGKTYLLAHAWRMASQPGVSVPVSDDFVLPELPGPQLQKFFQGVDSFPYGESLEWRFTQGAFDRMGPATVWARARIPLIDGRAMDPLDALVLMMDSANGVSAELDILKWTFVPVDMTLGLIRHPIGPWTGMAARTTMGTDGIGQTAGIAFDTKGSVGRSLQTLFIRPK